MGILDKIGSKVGSAVKRSVGNAVSNAVGNAVKKTVEPQATKLANKVINETEKVAKVVVSEGYCPNCGKENPKESKFCKHCGGKLEIPEVNNTYFSKEKNELDIAKWNELLPVYPIWECGGNSFELDKYDGFVGLTVEFMTYAAAEAAVKLYRNVLRNNGFKEEGEYPSEESLYKKVNGISYHVDTGHCFEADNNRPSIYFNIEEPTGGYDYSPKKKGLFGFKKR